MNILVINLMRLGDLAQCTPVLRGLKAQYPDGIVTLLVMDLFEEAARLIPHVDRLITFPSTALAAAGEKPDLWPQSCRLLADWLTANFSPPPDLVINLTPNLLGGILTFATQGRELRGLAVNQARELFTRPAWASYSLVISRARQVNPFNLVDLFTLGAGLTPDGLGLHLKVPPEIQSQVDAVLAQLNLPADAALVGLIPGASQPQRRWPPAAFARMAQLLLARRPCHFLIFGSASEKNLGEEIKKQLPPQSTSLFLGGTSIPLLIAYLQRLHLLITNDTGPMHLAAALDTPILALFLASARVHDTGPVGKGHIALEPRLDCHPCRFFCHQLRCHKALTPEIVAFWGLHLLDKRPLLPLEDCAGQSQIRVYYSTFDPWGYHIHLPLLRQPLDQQHFWLWVHRVVWPQVLGSSENHPEPVQKWVTEILSRHYLPPAVDLDLEQARKNLQELQKLTSRGQEVAEQILKLASCAHELPVRLWQKGEELRHIDPQLRRLAMEFPALAPFIEFFFQEQRANNDRDIVALASELRAAYRRLYKAGEICLQVMAAINRELLETSGKTDMFASLAYVMQKDSFNTPYHQKCEVTPCL